MKTSFFSHSDIFWNLVSKYLKAKYAGSFLGMMWAFINPLLLAMIISFVFTNILKIPAGDFYLFVLSGILPWTFLSGSLQEASLSIPANAALLKQFPLPRAIIPLSVVMANFILLVFGLFAVMPLFLIAHPGMIFALPLLAVALVMFFIFTLGLSLLLSSLCVQFRDISHILNTFLMFWLWLTPVFYTIDIVPQEYRAMIDLNPIQPFLTLFRGGLLKGASWSFAELMICVGSGLLVVTAGACLFIYKEKSFLQRI